MVKLTAVAGVLCFILFASLFSTDRKKIVYKTIFWGLGLQLVFALLIFTVPPVSKIFLIFNELFNLVMSAAGSGTNFLFGALAPVPGQQSPVGFVLAFQSLPTIIFFSSLMSILHYLGVLKKVVNFFSRLFARTFKTSGAESFVAASEIFAGVETAFAVKPYLQDMTESELTLALTAGMATVASNVLALYVFTLQGIFPNIAAHLVSASLLNAPAAVLFAKILVPESSTPKTFGTVIDSAEEKDGSFFEAVINGSMNGLKAVAGIAAVLISVLSLLALADLIFSRTGGYITSAFNWNFKTDIASLLGWVFSPFAFLMGINSADVFTSGRIIGERLVITEVPAYFHLAEAWKSGVISDPRSVVILSYALCGFAHVASMAIFVGGYAALIPGRISSLTKIAPRALLAATLACLTTGAVAGIFYNPNAPLFLIGGR